MRKNVPPCTTRLAQQFSFLVPQFVNPGPLDPQLGMETQLPLEHDCVDVHVLTHSPQ
jgi:hypothetical protein